MTLGYSDAMPAYYGKGWRCILPLPAGAKKSPPAGRTGYSGEIPSYPDMMTWAEVHPGGNTALRLPPTVIGIDVDHYDNKRGGHTLKHAASLWGELPPTVRTTSRDDGQSGIRLYRVPEGTHLRTTIGFPELNLGDIEVVQFFHRYAIVWPSIHPNGGQYRWLDADNETAEIPAVDELPELPQAWIDGLKATTAALELSGQVDVEAILAALPDGPASIKVHERTEKAIADLASAPESRHDTTTRHVLALLRYGEQGESGVPDALKELGAEFVKAIADRESAVDAGREFVRMITNQRGHQLIESTPTINLDITAAPAIEPDEGIVAPEREAEPTPPTPGEAAEELTEIDGQFWAARESLTAIWAWSHGRYTSPWSALGVVLCRAIAQVPPWVTLPPIIGGKGSLNLFSALVGPSGGGKGASVSVASQILPNDIYTAKLGSGEGLVKTFGTTRKEEGRYHTESIRNRVMFGVDEVDTIAGLGSRLGSTLMPALRSLYAGESLGFGYADPTKRVDIPAHAYRATLYVGVQPGRAGALLSDSDGGTPQRFIWLPTTDPRIGSFHLEEPDFPNQLLSRENWGNTAHYFVIPNRVRDVLLENHIARQQGRGDALDGHALFTREKVAAALAVLDHRDAMTIEDWDLAGVVMTMSDRTREAIAAHLAALVDREAVEYGKRLGVTADVRDEAVNDRKVARVRKQIIRALSRAEGNTLTQGRLLNKIAYRDRDVAEQTLGGLIGEVVVFFNPDTKQVTLPSNEVE